MKRNTFETLLGAFVLVIAIVFAVFFQRSADIGAPDGSYFLEAQFNSIDGLDRGTDVRISGVSVGKVVSYRLDPDSYAAIVTMQIKDTVKIPYDTAAVISSESLLGGKFLSLEPGGDTVMLEPGERIEFTQSTPSIEKLLGQAIYSLSQNDDDKK